MDPSSPFFYATGPALSGKVSVGRCLAGHANRRVTWVPNSTGRSDRRLGTVKDYDALARLVEAVENLIPFNRAMGLTGFRVESDTVHIRVPMKDDLVGNFARGNLHGGVISATLDVVGGIAALFGAAGMQLPDTTEEGLEIFSRLGTIDMRVDYLRPGIGEWFDASGTVIRTGKRVAVTRMEMRDDQDRLIAVGTGTYIIG